MARFGLDSDSDQSDQESHQSHSHSRSPSAASSSSSSSRKPRHLDHSEDHDEYSQDEEEDGEEEAPPRQSLYDDDDDDEHSSQEEQDDDDSSRHAAASLSPRPRQRQLGSAQPPRWSTAAVKPKLARTAVMQASLFGPSPADQPFLRNQEHDNNGDENDEERGTVEAQSGDCLMRLGGATTSRSKRNPTLDNRRTQVGPPALVTEMPSSPSS